MDPGRATRQPRPSRTAAVPRAPSTTCLNANSSPPFASQHRLSSPTGHSHVPTPAVDKRRVDCKIHDPLTTPSLTTFYPFQFFSGDQASIYFNFDFFFFDWPDRVIGGSARQTPLVLQRRLTFCHPSTVHNFHELAVTVSQFRHVLFVIPFRRSLVPCLRPS